MWNRRNLSDLGHLKSVTKDVILKHLRNPQTQENLWNPEGYKTCETMDIWGLLLRLQYTKTVWNPQIHDTYDICTCES